MAHPPPPAALSDLPRLPPPSVGLDHHRDHQILHVHLQPPLLPATLPHLAQVLSSPHDLAELTNLIPRYTFFIVAYPSGVSGELLCQYAGLLYAYKQDVLSLHLPNKLNASFSFPLFILITMLLYIPLFPPMYLHMFGQRKKVLGSKKEE